jgi:hypothetical protein
MSLKLNFSHSLSLSLSLDLIIQSIYLVFRYLSKFNNTGIEIHDNTYKYFFDGTLPDLTRLINLVVLL